MDLIGRHHGIRLIYWNQKEAVGVAQYSQDIWQYPTYSPPISRQRVKYSTQIFPGLIPTHFLMTDFSHSFPE